MIQTKARFMCDWPECFEQSDWGQDESHTPTGWAKYTFDHGTSLFSFEFCPDHVDEGVSVMNMVVGRMEQQEALA